MWVFVASLFGACGADSAVEPTPVCIPQDASAGQVSADAPARAYFIDSIALPATLDETLELGFDLDLDELGRVDNVLGQVLMNAGAAADIELALNESIALGDLLPVVSIRSDGAVSAPAELTLFQGLDADNLAGDPVFAIDPTQRSGAIGGALDGNVFVGSGGTLPIALTVPGVDDVYTLSLAVANVEATITPTGIEGRIGGAIELYQLADSLYPMLVSVFNNALARDCGADGCAWGSLGWVADAIDDGDGMLTVDELSSSPTLGAMLQPDLDVHGPDGVCDGQNDSLSFGFAFTARPATAANRLAH